MTDAVCASPGLIVALDVDTPEQAVGLVERIGPAVHWYKIGNQLFTRHGPRVVHDVKALGKKIFLDLKFHDIPNTVANAVRSAAALGVDMTNVHAAGGPDMLTAAAEAAADTDTLVIAVTVLTSMDRAALAATGVDLDPAIQVVRLARLAQDSGIAGVVCSAMEIRALREACGDAFVLVVPGIRPAGDVNDDQKRVMTPAQAAGAGASYIVVGRPVRNAQDPAAAAGAILAEMERG